METRAIFPVDLETVSALIRAARDGEQRIPGLTTFSGFPTAMLFSPSEIHAGSLHYMHFPTPASQRVHRHPSDRCLLILGDIDVYIHHSNAGPMENPLKTLHTIILERQMLYAVRFGAHHWHQFETRDQSGSGVIAFSVHGDDQLGEGAKISTNLMEELTFYWEEDERATN